MRSESTSRSTSRARSKKHTANAITPLKSCAKCTKRTCSDEKVVESPEDADYGMILGTGFAPFRGGPLRFADHFGLKKVADEMGRLAQSDEKFTPCELLRKHARNGTKFYES